MGKEIERKYLVSEGFRECITESETIHQGFISNEPEKLVRVRLSSNRAYLTIKGKMKGISRFEWETEIEDSDAKDLLNLCDNIIEKTRYTINYKGTIIEVDEFHKQNQGLIIAEVELTSEDDNPELPDWIKQEITSDPRYQNVELESKPFKDWQV